MIFHSIAWLSLIAAHIWIFGFTPAEIVQGNVQKIFYVHVASAITMYVGFFIAFLTAIFWLFERKPLWEQIQASAVEVGFLFCTIVLITGPIWARPIWGTWWQWEPRLTTTLLLWLLYAAYLLIRGHFATSTRRPLISSVLAIVAFLDVPLIHYSVKLWRGIHPNVISGDGGGLPGSMQLTLVVTLAALLLLFFSLLGQRIQLERKRDRLPSVLAPEVANEF